MADQKLTALTEDTAPASTDYAYTVKDPGGTPLSRRATWLNILKGQALGILTSDGDLFTRAAGVLTRITRASLAGDSAFSSVYVAKSVTGFTVVDVDQALRTAGNLTLNNTGFTDVPTISTLTLNAASGDVVEFYLNAVVDTGANEVYLDVATIVSSSPVNYFSNGTGTPATAGISAFSSFNRDEHLGGSARYTLQSGDISGGTVTLKLRYKTSTAANRSLRADSTRPLQYGATVYRLLA